MTKTIDDAVEKEGLKPDKILEQLAGLDKEQLKTVSKILKGIGEKKEKKIILPFSQKHVRLGVASDNHITSLFFNKKCLDYLYHVFKEEGAKFVVNAGDITDGEQMHKGHQNHLKCHGVMRMLELVANEFPDVGLNTHFIIGNHDYSFYKQNGVDIGELISNKRKDLIYIGNHKDEKGFEGAIQLGEKTTLMLFHPGKGTAKGLSYQPQGILETMEGEEKPKILLVGHYHKMDYLFERNVHTFQAGTTENQSEWMRERSIQAHVGGLLLDVYMKDDGTVDKLRYRMIRKGW